MSVRISACWTFLNILLGFILFVNGEHFFLPKENEAFSNDVLDDWVPVAGIDKRSTRQNHGYTQVVHITPPVRYPNRPVSQQTPAAASNKIEVFAQPPPTILGSFSEFGHATIEAREPAHALNFRPSYNFDRHYEEINDRRYQQNDYQEQQEEQKPPAIVVFNAQQRHPQNYHKPPPPPPPPFYQNVQFHDNNNNNNNNNNKNHHHSHSQNKNFGFKEPSAIQEPPKRPAPYFASDDHVYLRPPQAVKQAYAEQRPKPYLVSPVEPVRQQQQFKPSTETPAGYFQKYPGHVDSQKLFPQISNYARPFEQTNVAGGDHSVYIKPDQYVHNLNVATEVRFGSEFGDHTRPAPVDLSSGFTHPATRPFSKFQTPSPKNEELYRIFPVKEVNALPTFLPTPITFSLQPDGRPYESLPPLREQEPVAVAGSSEYDARDEQDENESGEQYDILKSPTKAMAPATTSTTTTTTTTSTTTTAATPRATRKRRPTSTTTTTTATPDEYDDEYAVVQSDRFAQQRYRPSHYQQPEYEATTAATYAEPPPAPVNKYKKKKPLPKPEQPEPVDSVQPQEQFVTVAPQPVLPTAATAPTTITTTSTQPPSVAESDASGLRAKTKAKYGNGTRPRFSIKDYKSTTTAAPTTTTTEKAGRRTTATPVAAATAQDQETEAPEQQTGRKPYKPRLRPANRYKGAAAITTTTTTTEEPQQETTTERRTAYRNKYKPGKYYNRLRTSTETAAAAEETTEQAVVATEPAKPAVYSAKRRTVPKVTAVAPAAEESNALRRSSSSPPGASEIMDAASSEDVDYVATTVAVTESATVKRKYHMSYMAERPLLPIETFFQSSKRHGNHAERR